MPEWTSICLCLSGVFAQASTHILRASYSSDIGITTNTTSDFSSTCVVLALVAGRQDCQPRPNSQRQPLRLFLSSFRLQHFYMTVDIASEMHSNASRSLTQPLLDCMLYLTQYLYDPGSANKCILGNVYLRSNLSRNIATALSLSIDTYMHHSVGYISTVLLILSQAQISCYRSN